MKAKTAMLILAAGLLVPFVFSGCGAQGGTVTLVNESSQILISLNISLGRSEAEKLFPGQSMKASADADTLVNAAFSISGGGGNNLVDISNTGGVWSIDGYRWTSSLFSVNGGDSYIITIKDKSGDAGGNE